MKARVLWQSCVVVALGAVGYVASDRALAQATVDCSSVAEDMARLKCYDEQAARQKRATASPPATTASPATVPAPVTAAPPAARSTTSPPATPSTMSPSRATSSPATPAPPASASAKASPSATPATPPAVTTTSATSDFGLNAEAIRRRQAAANPDTPKEPDQIVARVQSVVTKPRGEYRITLDDGQVWEETQHSSSNLPPNVGETITIKRGMLGSYFLSHSAGLALRVKRIN